MRGSLLISVVLTAAMARSSVEAAGAAQPADRARGGPPCDQLTSLTIPHVRIESASVVPAGPMAESDARVESGATPRITLPSHCRVTAVATPTSDSRIGIEVWIPTSAPVCGAATAPGCGEPHVRWNGKLLGTGNGGFSSRLGYQAMADGLARGYAVAGTDTGHTGDSTDFGNEHPEKIVDWAHRAVHVMTDVAKLVVRNAQGSFPTRAYFSGCSTGGQQALSEAQRYPEDYDGIIAGDPGHNRLHLIYGFLWTWLATHDSHGQVILPSSKLPALHAAVMKSCDAQDGLKDGLISDPSACRFDPAALTCSGSETNACLTSVQVGAVRKVYAGPRHPKTRQPIFAGWARGSELDWRGYITDPREPVRVGVLSGWAFHNPAWDPRSFDWDRDIAYVDAVLPFVSATSANLSAFTRRGGKLLMYTGLADAVVPPQDTIDYYERAITANGGLATARRSLRFFPVPGMGHCGGGTGPNRFDMLTALEAWVERGVAPDHITAQEIVDRGVVRSRPLCAWPTRARFKGVGDALEAQQFTCADPNRRRRPRSRRR